MSASVKKMVVILVTITVVAAVTLFTLMYFQGKASADGERSVDDIIDHSFETSEITTDIKDGNFVRISFRIVTDDAKTKKKLQKDFRIQTEIIKELSVKTEDDFRSGLSELEASVKERLNKLLQDGQVTDIYTVKKVLQ
ncbi:flagellar basal body-associated FliL family protein [Salirhabdus salicampi]|uniref:flagellar basal body-associated FliL family protein n=1 Tax=Salirhabdus salicampi TaxID=476102 RepID=UPI0020C4A78E|nr:flagellar basal body-associated FliL family protein [Salirhabdus salicampi]MCP8616514.1 flagellar basal body-associated FliL family protein [Salirhabdus salicampi]